jgi:hypothetical protein
VRRIRAGAARKKSPDKKAPRVALPMRAQVRVPCDHCALMHVDETGNAPLAGAVRLFAGRLLESRRVQCAWSTCKDW